MSQDLNVCGICDEKEPIFLHYDWHNEEIYRLCTSCILLRHKWSFCPGCLDFYEDARPADAVVCSRCHSFTHPKCVSTSILPPLCSWCRDMECLTFALKEVRLPREDRSYMAVDLKKSKLLLAATSISLFQMKKAAEAAQKVVERIGEEVVPEQKKAKEAVNNTLDLAEMEKTERKKAKEAANDALDLAEREKTGRSRRRSEIDPNEGPSQ